MTSLSRPFRPTFESLEPREVPATAMFANGVLEVLGTAQGDVIAIRTAANGNIEVLDNNVLVVVQGGPATTANTSKLQVNTGGGDDAIDMTALKDMLANSERIILRIILAGSGKDTVLGSELNDFIGGEEDDDRLEGNGGEDTLLGNAGNDVLIGGAAKDIISGGAGFLDRMFGGDGNDTLGDDDGALGAHGGKGDDVINLTCAELWNNNGSKRLPGKITGGEDKDIITVTIKNNMSYLEIFGDESNPVGGNGNDTITLKGTWGFANIYGGGGNDDKFFWEGNSRFNPVDVEQKQQI